MRTSEAGSRRFDAAGPGAGTPPLARLFTLLAGAVALFTVYVSLLPFDLRLRPPWDAWDVVSRALSAWPRRVPRANFLANLLLFVPFGFALSGASLVGRGRRYSVVSAIQVLVAGLAVSLVAEGLQVFAPRRIVSLADVVAQGLGAVVGIAAWAAAGPGVAGWLHEAYAAAASDRMRRLLAATVAAWVFVNLAPFDITLNASRLAQRLRDGHIVLVPFASAQPVVRQVWDAVVTTVSAMPIGGLVLLGVRPGHHRTVGAAVAWGVALLIAIELAQVVIRSHAADVTDVLTGSCGVAAGVWAALAVSRHEGAAPPPGGAGRRWAWTACAASLVLVCAYHWQPFGFAADSALVRWKLARLSLLPFAGLRGGSDLTTFGNVLARVGLAVPCGFFAWLAIQPPRADRIRVTAGLLLSAAFFAIVEGGQLFVPSRIPDPTDVWLGVAGSAVGAALGQWLEHGTRAARVRPGAGPAA